MGDMAWVLVGLWGHWGVWLLWPQMDWSLVVLFLPIGPQRGA